MTSLRLAGLCVLLLGLGVGLEGVRLVRRWRMGRAAKVDWRHGLLDMPRRYLVDVHHVVARDRFAAAMHALVAGGFLAGSILLGLGAMSGLAGARGFQALVTLAFVLMLAGAVMVGARRWPVRPARLSGGRFQVLPFLLLTYGTGGAVLGAACVADLPDAGWCGLLLLAAGGCGLVAQIRGGPMRHAFAGTAHLVAHPRRKRFGRGPATALETPNLDAARLGVETPADFAWNRLAGFDACIQCGRCEAACPAFAAGNPLNPKKLIQDLAACLAPSAAPAYAGSPHPGLDVRLADAGPHRPIIGTHAAVAPETLWSCTTCRACVEECPMLIEHVDAIIDLRRFQVMEKGLLPAKAAFAVSGLRYADDAGGRSLASRFDFAAGLDVPVMSPDRPVDVLLWVGEGAFDQRYGRTLRALIALLRHARVDFAVLGEAERDCGDVARRLGDEATFQDLARANITTLSRYRFARLVTADPHAYHALKNEYADFGAAFAVLHHTALLADLIDAGRITPGSLPALAVTYHDPCYLARYNGETDAPRAILKTLGVSLREMQRHGKRGLCCGGGGGVPFTDIPGERRIGDLRMAQARDTGSAVVAVACPGCTAMLEAVPEPRPKVEDIAELLWRSLESAT